MGLGSAVVTGAGRLPFRLIVHVAGIDMLWRASRESIQSSVRAALAAAEGHGLRSLAFPVIGAGAGGYPHDDALGLMREAFHALDSAIEVTVVTHPSRTVARRSASDSTSRLSPP